MTVGSVAKNLAVNANGAKVNKSSLDFNGKLLLDRTAAATVQASGTASTGEALLDLSDATLSLQTLYY